MYYCPYLRINYVIEEGDELCPLAAKCVKSMLEETIDGCDPIIQEIEAPEHPRKYLIIS